MEINVSFWRYASYIWIYRIYMYTESYYIQLIETLVEHSSIRL